MQACKLNIQLILEELLLNQALTKHDIARIVQIPVRDINQMLSKPKQDNILTTEQLQTLIKLYKRMKSFEGRIEDYLVKVRLDYEVEAPKLNDSNDKNKD